MSHKRGTFQNVCCGIDKRTVTRNNNATVSFHNFNRIESGH